MLALIGNGELGNPNWAKPFLSKCDSLIAVDGGLRHCDQLGLSPDLVVGDFDSVDRELLLKYSNLPTLSYPTDKDESDLELALAEGMKRTEGEIALVAVTGGRLDHTLSNLQLLARTPGRIKLYTDQETIWAVTGRVQIQCKPQQTLSLLPIYGPALGVTSRGLKWELKSQTLNEWQISLSNIALGESFSLSIEQGSLLLSLSRP